MAGIRPSVTTLKGWPHDRLAPGNLRSPRCVYLAIVGPFSKILEQELILPWPPQPPRGDTSAPGFCPQPRAYNILISCHYRACQACEDTDKNCESLRSQRLTCHCARAPASTR